MTPIILLTARNEETDRVLGLEFGADDYVSKPFSPRELVARVKVVLRRSEQQGHAEGRPTLTRGPLVVDAERRSVTLDDTPIALTTLEFDLLYALASQGGCTAVTSS